MGRKKKKKNNVIRFAKSNIKILESGKLKVKKGQKISLKPYIKQSVDGSICSRLDAVLSKEEVVVDTKDCRLASACYMNTPLRLLNLLAISGFNDVHTIVHVCKKSECEELFDYIGHSVFGDLLRTSTLAASYKELKDGWMEVLESGDKFTDILFIPNIYVFLDPDTGEISKHPFTVNLLLVAEPSRNAMNEITDIEDDEIIKRYIDDSYEAAIKCGAKHLVIDPFCAKVLLKNEHDTSRIWKQVITTERAIEHINSVDFATELEDLYIIFSRTGKIQDI